MNQIGNVWNKRKGMENILEMFWKSMEKLEMFWKRFLIFFEEKYGKCFGNVLEKYGKCFGNVLEKYGKIGNVLEKIFDF